MFKSAIGLVYVVVGFIVANSHGYLAIGDLMTAISAMLAILLWPLVLLGFDLHIGG